MKTSAVALRMLFMLAITAGLAAHADGQATRTWVSGVGDDVNPCSRTAPCKTFAGAISKTAAGGEISVLDPGGYGTLTITKALTIDGTGQISSVLNPNVNGIIINAGANDVVILRNLQVQGARTGTNGIRFVAGKAVHVENCMISNQSGYGIDFEPNAAAALFVSETHLHNCAGGGIYVKPASGLTADASVEKVKLQNGLFGLRADDGARVAVHDSVASGNSANGFVGVGNAAASQITLDNCVSANNGQAGAKAVGPTATIRLSGVTLTGNANGVLTVNGGTVASFGTNRIAGNTTDGTPTSTISQQ